MVVILLDEFIFQELHSTYFFEGLFEAWEDKGQGGGVAEKTKYLYITFFHVNYKQILDKIIPGTFNSSIILYIQR